MCGKSCADLIGVAIPKVAKLGIDFATPAALGDDRVELFIGRRPDAHAQAIVGKNLELFGVFFHFAGHLRVHPARVVADHSAERVAVVRCGIGPKR